MKICHYDNNQAGVVVGDKVFNYRRCVDQSRVGAPGLHHARNHRRAGQQSGGDADCARCCEQCRRRGFAFGEAARADHQSRHRSGPRRQTTDAHRAEMVDRMGSANKQIKNKDDLMAEFFLKTTSSIIGPGDTIILPKISKLVDFECELCAVIGKTRAQSDRGAVARLCVWLHDLLGHQPARSVGQGHAQHAQYSQRLRYVQRSGAVDRHAR